MAIVRMGWRSEKIASCKGQAREGPPRGPDEVRRVSQTAKWGPSPTLVQGNTADGWSPSLQSTECSLQSMYQSGREGQSKDGKTGHPEDGDKNERMRRRLYLESTCDWMMGSEGLRWGERLLTCILLVWALGGRLDGPPYSHDCHVQCGRYLGLGPRRHGRQGWARDDNHVRHTQQPRCRLSGWADLGFFAVLASQAPCLPAEQGAPAAGRYESHGNLGRGG
ncbi:hypothetical protein BDP55DRAFT_634779 [Colletotrichum godetiae]|uniref:Uncharacterized protein n=1 Tax=Colletotrichum godetiae TaxID=1209918 RepID=A0AAJ0AFY1_9PEZI|nr:uncharacterized protein BDP55DRAFT_634779 [Colletotrichum godetiae]KAK1672509.1 hypothetical protein BDP55DRAFT_634779 [Colletotrichum godetiae]